MTRDTDTGTAITRLQHYPFIRCYCSLTSLYKYSNKIAAITATNLRRKLSAFSNTFWHAERKVLSKQLIVWNRERESEREGGECDFCLEHLKTS